jgi:hypothetical protein
VTATRFRRPVAALLLIAATVVAGLLPPAHIHLAAHDDHHHHHDHATTVEHAHWSSHGPSRAALDDDDGRAIYVDHPAVASTGDPLFARPYSAIIALLIPPAPATFTFAARPTSGNSPRDGPLRGASLLRAPPAFVTL